jgi:hypothetical protein
MAYRGSRTLLGPPFLPALIEEDLQSVIKQISSEQKLSNEHCNNKTFRSCCFVSEQQ